jgi:hypothetical protein
VVVVACPVERVSKLAVEGPARESAPVVAPAATLTCWPFTPVKDTKVAFLRVTLAGEPGVPPPGPATTNTALMVAVGEEGQVMLMTGEMKAACPTFTPLADPVAGFQDTIDKSRRGMTRVRLLGRATVPTGTPLDCRAPTLTVRESMGRPASMSLEVVGRGATAKRAP